MRSKKTILQFKSVKTRMIFWMLIISILPLLISTGIFYNQHLQNIQTMQFIKLEVIRDLKIREINRWLEARVGDLVVARQGVLRSGSWKDPSGIRNILRMSSLSCRTLKGY